MCVWGRQILADLGSCDGEQGKATSGWSGHGLCHFMTIQNLKINSQVTASVGIIEMSKSFKRELLVYASLGCASLFYASL